MADNTVHAVSIAMPILPYVPPNSAQIMDLISNAFGVTAPSIEDADEKMNAYMKIYQGILGQTYNTFKEKLDNIIDNAKTSGKIVIDNNASAIIQQALNQAVTTGYEIGATQPITDFATLKQRIKESDVFYSQLSESIWSGIESNVNNTFGQTSYTAYLYNINRSGRVYRFLNFYPANITLHEEYNITFNNANYYYAMMTNEGNSYSNVIYQGYEVNTFPMMSQPIIGCSNYFNGNTVSGKVNYGVMASYENVSTQTQSITNALTTQEVVPVTAETDTANMSGDIVIKIPAVTVYPAETVSDLPTVQEKLGVIPTTPDTTVEQLQTIIESLQEAKTETYGDVEKYSINLTEYFPFCIPFDIGNILTMFVAEPQAPVITIPLPIGYGEEGIILQEFTLDLSQFDTVALWCRRGMLLVFIVGLAMVTRRVFLRG